MKEFRKSIYREMQIPVPSPPGNCKKVNITVSLLDLNDSDDDTIRFYYTNCDGNPDIYLANNEGTFLNVFCADAGSGIAKTYLKEGVETEASNSGFTITADDCDV